jgi:DNA-binding protein HU-beta
MVKQDLCKNIAQKTNQSIEAVKQTIDQFMAEIKEANAKKETVYLRGFGTFSAKLRAAKKAQNISKKETIEIPAHNVPYFKPSDEFKNAVNN